MQKITHKALFRLQSSGFNLLESNSVFGDEDPVYVPKKVEDVDDYLIFRQSIGLLIGEERILIIARALTEPEWQLVGTIDMY